MLETFLLIAAIFALPSAALVIFGEWADWYLVGRNKD
jgi:hypothetical protein